MVHTLSRQFRPLSELNLIDNFLFHEMMADKENGEKFCRILLKTILNKEVRHVKITPQKNILGPNTNNHGIRMDAYLEEVADCDAIDADIAPDIYDIECVHHMVDRIKERKELNLEYMKSWEWDDYNKKLGREEGKKEERKNSIHILISTCKKLSCDDTLILDELMSNFSLSCEEAIAYLEEYSK